MLSGASSAPAAPARQQPLPLGELKLIPLLERAGELPGEEGVAFRALVDELRKLRRDAGRRSSPRLRLRSTLRRSGRSSPPRRAAEARSSARSRRGSSRSARWREDAGAAPRPRARFPPAGGAAHRSRRARCCRRSRLALSAHWRSSSSRASGACSASVCRKPVTCQKSRCCALRSSSWTGSVSRHYLVGQEAGDLWPALRQLRPASGELRLPRPW